MTDTATATAAAMNAENVADAPKSALERRIDITLNLADIEPDIEFRLKQLAHKVKLPGFRPGKAPVKMVAQQFGNQARFEAVSAAVENVVATKLEEQKLRVVGQPDIRPAPSAGEGKLGFTAVFEIYPEIILADLSGRSIEKPTLTVTDAELEQTLESLRKQRVTYSEVERPAQKDDRVTIDFVGRKDGVEFDGGKADDFAMIVGGGTMLPDFEAAIEGVKAGDKKTFDVKFPDDYQAKELAGATAQFDITVKKVEAPQLPALDAEFAKAMGVADGNVDTMRAEVKANLEREVKKRLSARVKQQVMDLLLETHPFDVPQALVDRESRQLADNAKRDMEARGMPVKDLPVDPAWFADKAVSRVRLGLLLAEIVNVKNLRATPEQVRAVIDDFAASFEDPKEVVRWYYSQPERMAEADALAIENNVVDWVLGNVSVTEKPISFDELMGNKA
jgi:trigger factor